MNYETWKRERGCERKATYFCELCANAAVLRLWKQGKYARKYRCDYCTNFHLTTTGEPD